MTASGLINKALRQQIYLSASRYKLRLVCDVQPDAELMEVLRVNKHQVLAELHRLQELWLERVAHAVQVPAAWLLEHGLIDADDMRNLWHTEPAQAARIIIGGQCGALSTCH